MIHYMLNLIDNYITKQCNCHNFPCLLPAFYSVFSNKQISTNQNMKHKFDVLERRLRFQLPPPTSASFLSRTVTKGCHLKCASKAQTKMLENTI